MLNLHSLEEYDKIRPDFRAKVMLAKRTRQIQLGEHLRLLFENKLTIQYQIQEMLRIEKIFRQAEIQEEIDAYAPLITDRQNLKATMMLEYPDVGKRREMLGKLIDIEKKVWLQVGDLDKIYPVANEDLKRQTEDKTSAVHFLRFPITNEALTTLEGGASLKFGVEHELYNFWIDASKEIRDSLLLDLQEN